MSQKPVRKAIIAAAGLGTRFLPQTKAMPKEMLPIIDRPVIQLIVEEVVAAGVTDIIIVTGSTKRAIEDHFDRAMELEDELREKGKDAYADQIKQIAECANFIYVRQKGLPKGNARPVLNAAHLIGDEPFFVFFGDDFVTGEVPRAKQLLEAYEQTGSSVISLIEVNRKDADKYGMAALSDKVNEKTYRVTQLIEKPGEKDTPSNFASIGGYLLTPDILPIIAKEHTGKGGEITLADSINELAQSGEVYGRFLDGTYHDTGNPELYLQSIVNVALDDPKLGENFRAFLKSKLG
jgi:UTP--glucose-1-phosphate uridylyltransferase